MAMAWGNKISSNGRYDLYNAGSESFRAMGNWWGRESRNGFAGKVYGGGGPTGSGTIPPYTPGRGLFKPVAKGRIKC
jgi:hypothetical protein